MDVYVLAAAMHPASRRIADKRLEEVVYDTTAAALGEAGLERDQIEQVTIAACDELDGRSISSMLLAMPAGAYLKDEIKCTDNGLVGLCLSAMRMQSGLFDLGLAVSWCKPSIAPVEEVMRARAEPFFTRPVGLNMSIADGLFAQAQCAAHGITEDEATEAVLTLVGKAARNPRAVPGPLPSAEGIARSPYVAHPLRRGHQAPLSDGAVALVLASGDWLHRHPEVMPLARIAGLGWSIDGYALGGERLSALASFEAARDRALGMAGIDLDELDVIELDSQTGYHDAACRRRLDGADPAALSPSGGAFAQNPYFCTGLVNAAESLLQVTGRAGPVQRPGAARGGALAAAHGGYGFAQQGNVFAVFEGG